VQPSSYLDPTRHVCDYVVEWQLPRIAVTDALKIPTPQPPKGGRSRRLYPRGERFLQPRRIDRD
jgi:hypothetical protein